MKQDLSVLPETIRQQKKRKQLLSVIAKKRKHLQDALVKTETLRSSIQMAEQEYMAKVGSLYIKDGHLDLEIIRLQNIVKLLKEGLTYEEAEAKIAETYYAQEIEIEREHEKAKIQEQIFLKREEHKNEPMEDIRNIWKRLIAKFHPDLVQDKTLKEERDKVMQQINMAYQEGDLDRLHRIEQEHMEMQETTIENLEDILISLVNSIAKQKEDYQELRNSEWYDWMIKIDKAKHKNENIFADAERQILDDIVGKIDVLNQLRGMIRELDPEAAI